MTRYEELRSSLSQTPRRWLVTGAAGFIGSHLLETLLRLDQEVVGLDNFATGYQANLDDVARRVGPQAFARFRFIEGDIRDRTTCARATLGADVVLHEAALGSVPRSMVDPLNSHMTNVDGFLNVLLAARDSGVKRLVYASSSSVYGDEASEPKVEEQRGNLLSPYAATKLINEVYADTFRQSHGIQSVGLRYFNVFGPRQDPHGAYAAVIPRWTEALITGEPCLVYGDGSASRDFCYVDNVVQANLLAALAPTESLTHGAFNVACGARTSLRDLFAMIKRLVAASRADAEKSTLQEQPPRPGDILHSLASIDRARKSLGYQPGVDVATGMQHTVSWYADRAKLSDKQPKASAVSLQAQEAS